MPIIKLETYFDAPIEKVFDMCRDIDVHKYTAQQTNERAVGGVTTGLIKLGETVTWEARHLGVKQRLTSKITKMEFPNFFQDEMVKGAFKSFKHEHFFEFEGTGTRLKDVFTYVSPLGFLGNIADHLFLKRYMTSFLTKRNQALLKVVKSYE